MPRTRGSGSVYCRVKGCTVANLNCGHPLYIKFYAGGQIVRRSTETTSLKEAQRILEKKLAEARTGRYLSGKAEQVTLDTLYQDVRTDYIKNDQKTLSDLVTRWEKHLMPFFGARSKAISVTKDKLSKYVAYRKSQGAENATINRELSALKRMFTLAAGDKVQGIPKFPEHLAERNIRKGFVTDVQYAGLAEACSKEGVWLRAMFETAYRIGWRVGELQGLKVSNVDLLNRIVRLEPETTKNREGREAPISPKLYYWLEQCCRDKDSDRYVFSRDALGVRPVKTFLLSWKRVTALAGVPELIFHDLRRTAIRNMILAGIDEMTSMRISGHRTRTVFLRYRIVDHSDLHIAAQKMDAREALVHTPEPLGLTSGHSNENVLNLLGNNEN